MAATNQNHARGVTVTPADSSPAESHGGFGSRQRFSDYFFLKVHLDLPESPIALLPMGDPLSIGQDVGWLGYPNIEPFELCFFAGTVSAHLPARKAYLIDGVAIHGVSGGPVFHSVKDQVQIIGCVSAYQPNVQTGTVLPGLLKAQDVSHFHGVAQSVRIVDEQSMAKKREFEAQQDPEILNNLVPSPAENLGSNS